MRYCGREFTTADVEMICTLVIDSPLMSRAKLSRIVCERLNWRRPNGALKDMSCRVAMLRMQDDGLLLLPVARWGRPKAGVHPEIEHAVAQPPITPEVDLRAIAIDIVATEHDSRLWNAYIRQHHYLGYQPMAGAQLRYFVRAAGQIIAALGFGASAWKIKPRDQYIGWSDEQRRRNLHLIVNNARFLIFPWIRRPNLASRILSLVSRRLPADWDERYAYRPVLLETFVDHGRFCGGSYRAANWQFVGLTQGRGKLDRDKTYSVPVKSIWTYPLSSGFKSHLCR